MPPHLVMTPNDLTTVILMFGLLPGAACGLLAGWILWRRAE
jgi:hypothetical protein